jgi:hypothetical protein
MTMMAAMPMAHAKCSKFVDDNTCKLMTLMERRHIAGLPKADSNPGYKLKLGARINSVTHVAHPALQPNGSQILTPSEPKMTMMP